MDKTAKNQDGIYADGMFEELGHIAPHSPETETALLGAIILNNDCMHVVAQSIRPDDFYLKRHQRIYTAMLELHERSEPIDYVILDDVLKSKFSKEEEYGGVEYLVDLPNHVSLSPSVERYIEIIRNHSTRRNLIRLSRGWIAKSYDASENPQETVHKLMGEVETLFQNSDSNIRSLGEIWEEYRISLKTAGENVINTGYQGLDGLTGGIEYGTMGVIASWSSVGKTTFALNVAKKQALENNIPVLFISMETKRDQLFKNLLACDSKIDVMKLRNMNLTEPERQEMVKAITRLRSAPFFIDDSTSLTIKQIREKIYKAVHDHNCRVVYIDYYQLISSDADKALTREQRLSAISKELREIVNKHKIVLFLIAQLRDEDYKKGQEPPKPSPHHLRESRAVFHDCDLCLTLNRESYFKEAADNTVEVTIQKQRTGPRRVSVKLNYTPQKMLFESMGECIKGNIPEGYEVVSEYSHDPFYDNFPEFRDADEDDDD